MACNFSSVSLCSADLGEIFPLSLPRISDYNNGFRCGDSSGKILVNQSVYDFSSCDLFDEGTDIIFANGVIYYKNTSIPLW